MLCVDERTARQPAMVVESELVKLVGRFEGLNAVKLSVIWHILDSLVDVSYFVYCT